MKMKHFVFDPFFLIVSSSFLLALCGILTIGSSQSAAGDPLRLVIRQTSFLLSGLLVLGVSCRIKFKIWQKAAPLIAVVFWCMLLYLPFAGIRVNNMAGWIKIGSVSFQPSEWGRTFFLLVLTQLCCCGKSELKKFAAAAVLTGAWLFPIALQPDFGMIAVYGSTFFVLLFLAGISAKHLLFLAFTSGVAAGGVLLKYPYILRRISGFLFPESDPLGSGWHVRQFLLAVARGGWTGSKIGGAVWSNAYLPLSYNDSAGAALLETVGLTGAAVPAVLFAILILSFFKLALDPAISFQGRFFIAGTAAFAAIQMLVHMAVNLALIPTTGLVLPFISYGGSALTGMFLMTGVALSAAKDKNDFLKS